MILGDMTISRDYNKLFHQSTTAETLTMLQSLVDTRDVQPDEALALLGSVHADLRQSKGKDGSIYARYAQTMESLRHQMPEVHQHVVVNWQIRQSGSDTSNYDEFISLQANTASEIRRERESVREVAGEIESNEGGEGGEEE